MSPRKLEHYSFLWSQVRLVIAAVALFIGGVPPLVKYGFLPSGLTFSILTLCWIISGVASAYLLYRWNQAGKKVFGGTKRNDVIAFFISVVSGLNLGITGLTKNNIGMSISSNQTVFIIVGVIYLITAYYLHRRWSQSSKHLF